MDLKESTTSRSNKPEQRRRGSRDNGNQAASSSQVEIDMSFIGGSSTPLQTLEPTRNNSPGVTNNDRLLGGRRGYVERRISLWDREDYTAGASVNPSSSSNNNNWDEDRERSRNQERTRQQTVLGAVCSFPLPIQRAFRKKMLSVFACQLLFIWFLVSCFAYLPHLHSTVARTFHRPGYVAIPFAMMTMLLGLLYLVRERFPLNWLVLLIFSLAQSVFYAALGKLFDTNVGVFCCGFTFCAVTLMIPLSTLVRHRDGPESKLLPSFLAGCIAYVIVALLSVLAKVVLKDSLVTTQAFLYTLLLQLVLILWFASDASSMYRVMTPDEYMQGVIYFYTDLVLLVVVIALFVGLLALLSACGGEGIGGFSSMDCGYCGFCGSSDCPCCCCCNNLRDDDQDQPVNTAANGNHPSTTPADDEMIREGIV